MSVPGDPWCKLNPPEKVAGYFLVARSPLFARRPMQSFINGVPALDPTVHERTSAGKRAQTTRTQGNYPSIRIYGLKSLKSVAVFSRRIDPNRRCGARFSQRQTTSSGVREWNEHFAKRSIHSWRVRSLSRARGIQLLARTGDLIYSSEGTNSSCPLSRR